jgi:hypothetical protein
MFMALVLLTAGNTAVLSQDTKSVFGNDSDIGFIWGFDLKTASVQNELGTQLGLYAGALFYHAVMVGITGAANVTHPRINYGYTGLVVQYTFKPHNLLHLSGQVTLGGGSTKDYEKEKSSLFDNFGNVTGADFYLIEPGVQGEINLSPKVRVALGITYRFVEGINQQNQNIARTHVTDGDLSGFTLAVGFKFGMY